MPQLWTQRLEQYLLVLVSIRLGQGFSSLQTLFHAVQASLPSILNVSAIFMMVMCLFAILFMEFFGLTKFGPYGNDHANFRSYGNSLLTLVRMTTGENWVKYIAPPGLSKVISCLTMKCLGLFDA